MKKRILDPEQCCGIGGRYKLGGGRRKKMNKLRALFEDKVFFKKVSSWLYLSVFVGRGVKIEVPHPNFHIALYICIKG